MSNTDWLKNVQQVPVTAAHAQGRSETGAALAAIADAMDAEDAEPFSAGEVVGVVIERIGGIQYAVAVSTGNAKADILRLTQVYDATPGNVSLTPAAEMLTAQFEGVSGCLQLPKALAAEKSSRVTLDKLEYLLQVQRAEGVPGSTVVAVTAHGNGRPGVANFEVQPRVAHVAKAEFEKPWSLAKFVSRGGVRVLVLG